MIPLPPRIDPSVTMMQVEERPSITYADVGGCKEQIEKLREVVELPLLEVSYHRAYSWIRRKLTFSLNDLPTSVSNLPRVSCCTAPLVPVKPCALEQSQIEQTLPLSEVSHTFLQHTL